MFLLHRKPLLYLSLFFTLSYLCLAAGLCPPSFMKLPCNSTVTDFSPQSLSWRTHTIWLSKIYTQRLTWNVRHGWLDEWFFKKRMPSQQYSSFILLNNLSEWDGISHCNFILKAIRSLYYSRYCHRHSSSSHQRTKYLWNLNSSLPTVLSFQA